MATASLYVVIWKEGKYYVAQCLNVDVASFGSTRQEAVQNLSEAVELYFEGEQDAATNVIEAPEIISVPHNHV